MPTVRADQLGPLLKAFRERRGEPLQQVMDRFTELLEQHKDGSLWGDVDSWIRPRGTPASLRYHLKKLEKGNLKDERELYAILPLADAYDIPYLMLDPLISEVCTGHCLLERLPDFHVTSLEDRPHYGRDSVYGVPRKRLSGTDAAFVRLRLDPGGRSDTHDHPGDELLFVLDGTLEVRADNYGLRTPLGAGDYIHFYAEQPHSAWNVSTETAKAIIIRFYQLMHGGTRRKILRDLETVRGELRRLEAKLSPSGKRLFLDVVDPWLSETTGDPVGKVVTPNEILDPVGLSHLIQYELHRTPGPALQNFVAMAESSGYSRKRDALWKFLTGKRVRDSGRHDLDQLARVFDLPQILFYGFMFPPVPNFVVVHRNDDLVGFSGPEAGLLEGATYQLPCRSLAGSDIAMTFVSLRPGGASPENRHPGFELVLPLKGTVEVRFKHGTQCTVRSEAQEYAHFRSDIEHTLVNVGPEEATLFLVRFQEFLGGGVLEGGAQLPKATPAKAERVDVQKPAGADDRLYRLGELAVATGVPDLALNIDHYLYGHPRVDDAKQ